MFARFDENPAMTLRVIKETKRYGRTDGRTDNVKTVYPLQTKFAVGIKTDKQYVAVFFFVSQYNSSVSSFVPNFRILNQVVAEKSHTHTLTS